MTIIHPPCPECGAQPEVLQAEIDRLRAALAAAQAGPVYDVARVEGFIAGIWEAANKAQEWSRHSDMGTRIADAIRALRPPAAPAGAQPSEEELERMAKAIEDVGPDEWEEDSFHDRCLVLARAAYMALTEVHQMNDDQHYGPDCPKGMVQVSFVGCDPKLKRSEYGWKPCESTFLEVYIDGERFRIDVGNFQAGDGSWRRGLHINGPFDMVVDKHSVNAVDVYSPNLAANIKPKR